MTLIAEKFILMPTDGGPTLTLSRPEYDRFFDNRSPDGWQVTPIRFYAPAPAAVQEAQGHD